MLEVLAEAGLITVRDTGDLLAVECLPAQGKTDLEATPVMQYLRGMTAECRDEDNDSHD